MRTRLFIFGAVVILGLIAVLVIARSWFKRPVTSAAVAQSQQASTQKTPADRQIELAEFRIKNFPAVAEGYNQLAIAFMDKARETGDFSFNAGAEQALNRALEISPDDHTSLKLRAKLLLTYHRFKQAFAEAQRAQTSDADDADLYGIMTDALVELGDYPGAIKAAQRMMDLRPDAAAYSRASYLRALHGDLDGAIEAMRVAVKASNPNNPENASWYRVHLGMELMNAGKREEAEREFDVALQVFPGYHLALAAKGRARTAAGDLDRAVELYRQAQERVPLPEIVIALGDLYKRMGRAEEARRQYELVEFIERSGAENATYSRQLALFWADHDVKLDEALAVMQRESAERADIFTADALAWCLFKKGELARAREWIEQATKLGTRDARIFFHAGMIFEAVGARRPAAKYFKRALDPNLSLDLSQTDVAREKLAALDSLAQASKSKSASRS